MNILGIGTILLIVNSVVDSSLLEPVIKNVRHIKAPHPPENVNGVWKKKILWKPRWIKEWKSSNVLKPVWKKFWGPVIIREWVPIPKPPPQWDPNSPQSFAPSDTKTAAPGGEIFLNPGQLSQPPTTKLNYLPKLPSESHGYKYDPPKQAFPTPVIFNGGSNYYKIPTLPITGNTNSPAESYSGQTSYGTNVDTSAFDLNPPVEQYNPLYSDYGHKPLVANTNSGEFRQSSGVKPFGPHTHNHHHHHLSPIQSHLHLTNGPDQTKFAPNWNIWKPLPPTPHQHQHHHHHHLHHHAPSLTQQASSFLTTIQSTTPKQDVINNSLVQANQPISDNEFIQQAALVGEYHYTELDPRHGPGGAGSNVIPESNAATVISYMQPKPGAQDTVNHQEAGFHTVAVHHPLESPPAHRPLSASGHLQPHLEPTPSPAVQHHHPQIIPHLDPIKSHNPHPVHHPHEVHPPVQRPLSSSAHHSGVHHQPQLATVVPSNRQTSASHVQPQRHHHNSPKSAHQLPPHSSHNKKPQSPDVSQYPKFEIQKLPDFKALPSNSLETFHFVEGFPSNATLSKASLIGNINNVNEENQISIISPNREKVPPYVEQLAQVVVQQHLKNLQKNTNVSDTTQTVPTEPTTTTEKSSVAVVLPVTSSSINKTLKDYLADTNKSESSTRVFVVTPEPLKPKER